MEDTILHLTPREVLDLEALPQGENEVHRSLHALCLQELLIRLLGDEHATTLKGEDLPGLIQIKLRHHGRGGFTEVMTVHSGYGVAACAIAMVHYVADSLEQPWTFAILNPEKAYKLAVDALLHGALLHGGSYGTPMNQPLNWNMDK